VVNEITQICKETELSPLRLKYVKLMTNACLDSKVKYGCALWNIMKSLKAIDQLNSIKPRLIKRVMQIPLSTPSSAIQYEFGINDLALDVLMEKVVLAVQTMNLDDERIAKRLLKPMMEKNVDGFCVEVKNACKTLNVSWNEIVDKKDIRDFMKKRIIEIEGEQLLKSMMMESKMDQVLLAGFEYDGSAKRYLHELTFQDARVVFMARYRMLPTKANFPGRWKGTACNICGFQDTDVHIFTCPGYEDLNTNNITLEMFWNDDALNDMELLSSAAKTLNTIINRLEEVQKLQ
jgi:hypothetical protein